MRGDHAQAVAYFDAAVRFDPTLPNAHVARVNAYGALGQWHRVIAEHTETLRRDPTHALAYCARATAYNGIGRWDLAMPDADAAIRLEPNLYLGHDARGYALLQRGRFHPMLKVIAIVWMLATFSYWRRDHFDWRTPSGSKSDYDLAIAAFTEAIRLNPAAWDCYEGRALAYRALGNGAAAMMDQEKGSKGLNR